jgi:hypothetical protein
MGQAVESGVVERMVGWADWPRREQRTRQEEVLRYGVSCDDPLARADRTSLLVPRKLDASPVAGVEPRVSTLDAFDLETDEVARGEAHLGGCLGCRSLDRPRSFSDDDHGGRA